MASYEYRDETFNVSDDDIVINYHSLPGGEVVIFTFTYEYFVDEWILPEASSEPVFHRRVHRNRSLDINIHLDGHQYFNYKTVTRILKDELQHWPLLPGTIHDFVFIVLQKARTAYQSMTCSYNGFRIYIPVTIVHNYMYDERRAVDLAIQRSVENEEVKRHMVPAAESAIESLKLAEVPTDSADKCSICFEEMKGRGDTVAAPCSHAFHGDCIKKWFRTSHYCPLCRFEMPTD